jgi:GMP synthase (glutamine-hydrolysing)
MHGPAPALVLQHDGDAPAALLADWAAARGEALEVAAAGQPIPDLRGRPFLVILGSESAAYDDAVPWLGAERAVLDRALAGGVPILGICFGAQHLARALGATVAPLRGTPEVGWHEIETLAPEVVPEGPWLQWHRDAFTLPPGAELLARSPTGVQAFRCGPHLGVQFHPEVTAEIADAWAAAFPGSVAAAQTTAAAVQEGSRRHAAGAARRAFALFDAFLASARDADRMPSHNVG